VDQPTVLIISDDPDFPVVITSRWQSERKMPAFTLMSSDVCLDFDPDNFQLAIAAGIGSSDGSHGCGRQARALRL